MHIHILGVCGTFMGGIAVIARQLGHTVSGSDANVYPPMSDTLRAAGIEIQEGYDPSHLQPAPDMVVIGNAMSRGNPAVEFVLDEGIPYISGPQWLAEQALVGKHVLAVSGTHGKTTTTSILTWILQQAGLEPGYLIGGVAKNFSQTAALGDGDYFVIEADEYDSAFFDKRSKFIHYHPQTLIFNNLEFDHADIFDDLDMIKKQFQFLLRTVPGKGLVIYPQADANVGEVISRGCWSDQQSVGDNGDWQAKKSNADGSEFEIWHGDVCLGQVAWAMCGAHNVSNALVAAAAATRVGVSAEQVIAGLKSFAGVKRRLDIRGVVNNITVYDDFAHHPTAIETTLAGLRARVGGQRLIAILEFASNTMRAGVHDESTIVTAFQHADIAIFMMPEGDRWDVTSMTGLMTQPTHVHDSVDAIIQQVVSIAKPEDHVVIMSNKGFGGIHQRLLDQLKDANVSSQLVVE